jgi:surface polysaccharide O-acyltransferase-like enzyme
VTTLEGLSAVQETTGHAGIALPQASPSDETPARPSILWVHVMRVISAFLVVLGHANANIVEKWDKIPASHWWTSNIFGSLLRVSVLLFFLVSGWLLLSKSEPAAVFFKRRVVKVLIPFVVWACVYILWRKYYENEAIALPQGWLSIFSGPPYVYIHFWFMYALFELYLITPLLRIVIRHSSRSMIWYLVGMWLLATSVLPLLQRFTGLNSAMHLQFFGGYIGYYLLGHLIGGKTFSTRGVGILALCGIICMAFTSVITYILSVQADAYVIFFRENRMPNIVFTAVCVFFVLKWVGIQAEKLPLRAHEWIKHVSGLTYGIYLVHVIVLALLRDGYFPITLSGQMGHPIWATLITAIAGYTISCAFVAALQRIPIVRASVA